MRLSSSQRELKEFRRRFRWMGLFVILSFSFIYFRFIDLQLVKGSAYEIESHNNYIRTLDIPPMRGIIRDARGRILASNRPANSVFLTPHFFEKPGVFESKGAFDNLCRYLEITAKDKDVLRMRVRSAKGLKRFEPLLVKEDITRGQLSLIKTYQDDLPGVDVIVTPIRTYPFGKLAAHVVGYLNEIGPSEINSSRWGADYRSGDKIGREGIERAFERYLRGSRGWKKLLVDARGVPLKQQDKKLPLIAENYYKAPKPGFDISLSIDIELQKIVEMAFRGHPSGAAVVMDVNSGKVLSSYSKPSYDPNIITSGLSFAQDRELNENPFRPRIDKTLFENYFPGSTFKPFAAIAALQDSIIDPNDKIHCKGYLEFGKRIFKCSHVHGMVDLKEAIIRSCNVYFFHLAEKTGMNRIARYAKDFGFGKPTNIGYNSEVAGFIPTKEWYNEKYPGQFRIGFTLNSAIGQGNTKVTLMQLASAYSAIANSGILYKPYIVQRIEDSDGNLFEEYGPKITRNLNVNPDYLNYISNALVGVVHHSQGTAYEYHDSNITVAGKTGTAQVAKSKRKKGESLERHWYYNRDHAWFAAFAPAENPEISVIVLVDHGGHGGRFAAPIGMQIVKGYFNDISRLSEIHRIAENAQSSDRNSSPGVKTSIHPR